jgi:hypothetical protein
MTASDVREKDLRAALEYATTDGVLMTDQEPVFDAFIDGIKHARSEQAQVEKLVEALEQIKNGHISHGYSQHCICEMVAEEALAGWRKVL